MKRDKEFVLKNLKNLHTKLGRRPVKRDYSNLYFLSRKYFGSWNNLMKEAGYSVKEFQNPDIPDITSRDFYYFLGLLCTDGHIQFIKNKWQYKLIIFTSYDEEKEIILRLIQELFNYKASVRSKIYGFSKKPNYEIYISSKKICKFFNDLGVPYGNKSLNLKVPKIIFNLDNIKLWSFIRGVFDGDGSIIFSKSIQTFKISSGSQGFIEDLNVLLAKSGIGFIRVIHERENVWELKVGRTKELQKIYSLMYKDAYFYYPRKRLKWEQRYF